MPPKLPPPLPPQDKINSSFKVAPAVRVIARQLRDRNYLAAIFASRHLDASPGLVGVCDSFDAVNVYAAISCGNGLRWLCSDNVERVQKSMGHQVT